MLSYSYLERATLGYGFGREGDEVGAKGDGVGGCSGRGCELTHQTARGVEHEDGRKPIVGSSGDRDTTIANGEAAQGGLHGTCLDGFGSERVATLHVGANAY